MLLLVFQMCLWWLWAAEAWWKGVRSYLGCWEWRGWAASAWSMFPSPLSTLGQRLRRNHLSHWCCSSSDHHQWVAAPVRWRHTDGPTQRGGGREGGLMRRGAISDRRVASPEPGSQKKWEWARAGCSGQTRTPVFRTMESPGPSSSNTASSHGKSCRRTCRQWPKWLLTRRLKCY